MARARNIKPGFFINEDLVELPFSTRLLFIGLWTIADREGRLDDRPRKIKMAVFPADNVDIDAALRELHGAGLVQRYVVDNKPFIQIVNFIKHQNPHVNEAESTIPALDLHSASTMLATPLTSSLNPSSLNDESLFIETRNTSATANEVCEVFSEWQKVLDHPKAKLDKKRTGVIRSRLKDFTVDDLKKAIKGVSKSPYHLGENNTGTRYDGIVTIFRDADQVDKFIGLADAKPQKQTANGGHSGGYDSTKDIMSPDYIMPSRRKPYAERAEDYFNWPGGNPTPEEYESMKAHWISVGKNIDHLDEIEQYEQRRDFRERFSEAGSVAA